jgi:hypothetical protein
LEAKNNIENLKNALEMKMEAAVAGVLNTMAGLISGTITCSSFHFLKVQPVLPNLY